MGKPWISPNCMGRLTEGYALLAQLVKTWFIRRIGE
jgi:hypothetical protein